MNIDPEDPMLGAGNYRLVGRQSRFGGVVLYRVPCGTLDAFLKDGVEIGSTGVWGDVNSRNIFCVAWTRRHGTMKIKEAVACALLLHEHVILIRAFMVEGK